MNIQNKLKKQWENPKFRLFVIAIISAPILWVIFNSLFKSRDYVPLAERIESKKNENRVDGKGNLVGLFDTEKIEAIDANEFEEVYKESLTQLREREDDMYKQKSNESARLDEMQALMDAQALQIKSLEREKRVGYVANPTTYTSDRKQRRNSNNNQNIETPPQAIDQNNVNRRTQQQQQVATVSNYNDKPKIKGNVIRTITQRYVKSITRSGEVEVNEYDNNQLIGKLSKTKKRAEIIDDTEEKDESVYLPAGSFFGGVLLTGLDAPTQLAAKSSPMPLVVRIKKEAILPNSFSLDIRECFLVGSAIGDLSSERAYIRANTLSCIRDDGRAVEVKLQADAVSDYDGKLGISGRLVSKNGNLLAGSMAAGFMKGISDAVKPQRATSINTGANASPWAAVDLSNVGSAGALQGSSDAMSRLADYYIQLAEQIHPVIEITPGRSITFIVLKGTKLSIR